MAFVVVVPVAAWLAYRYERRIEETQVLSIFLSMMILVAAGVAGSFTIGSYAVVTMNLVALIADVVLLVRDHERMRHAVLTPGAVAYFILCAIMFIACYGRYLQSSDEFTYWAPLIRSYYYNGRFGDSMRYLEISAVWDSFATRVWLRCSTGMMMLGHATMVLSYLIPVYADCKGRMTGTRTVRCFLLTAMIWMLPMFGAGQFHGYISLYADMFLGAGMIYTLISFLRYRQGHHRFYYVSVLMGLASVVLAKQAGLVLGAILLFVMAGSSLAANPMQDRKIWARDAAGIVTGYMAAVLIAAGVPTAAGGTGTYAAYATSALRHWPFLVIVLVIVCAWILFFIHNSSRFLLTVPYILVFSGGVTSIALLRMELNLHQVLQVVYATCKTFLNHTSSHVGWYCGLSDYMLLNLVFTIGALAEILVYGRAHLQVLLPRYLTLTAEIAAISLALDAFYASEEFSVITFVLTAILMITEAILLARYLHGRQKWFTEQSGGPIYFWLFYYLVIGCVLYLLFYLSGMLMAFGEPEEYNSAQTARSLWRYMYSYMASPLFVAGYLVLRKEDCAYVGGYNPFWCLLTLVLLNTNIALGVGQLYDRPHEIHFTGMDGITLNADDVVCLVDMNMDNEPLAVSDYRYQFYMELESLDRVIDPNWFVDDALYGTRMTCEEIGEMLTENGCTYVYLRYVDMERGFAEYYADLFTESWEISTDRLYRVVTGNDGMVTLEYVPRQVE